MLYYKYYCLQKLRYFVLLAILLGDPFDPRVLLNNAVSNIICQMVFGRRYDYTDHTFQKILQLLNDVLYLEGTVWTQVL